ncbi:MAG: transposase [Candidatus Omnitrophica bacterium]|nr:transposase [Candidatus Omnitrophota bacterium]
MTIKDRKRYSREFKLEAVRRSYESGKPVTEVARELDISVHHLYRWRDQVTKQGENVWPGYGSGKKSSNNELEDLRRENEKLREERDILKKATTFFAKESERNIASLTRTEKNLG